MTMSILFRHNYNKVHVIDDLSFMLEKIGGSAGVDLVGLLDKEE